ncbi:hypothetical protein BYT27DRAFT_7158363 [Phlegmacium glaucopus]|nr:hypothetical protein BYT27DRAFT_7158363 [Phlegmacium glaucopus]
MHVDTVNAVNTLNLNSVNDSTIINVNLYSRQAEITRVFKFDVAAGKTNVVISGLPNVLDHESLRVEGKGPAIIHGVTSSKVKMAELPDSSPLLDELYAKEDKAANALARCKKAVESIEGYVGKLNVEHLDISKLGEAMDVYDITREKWDDKILRLVQEIEDIRAQKEAERVRLGDSGIDNKLRTQAVIGLYAEQAAEIDIYLIYAVSKARWEAGYDIRVNMQKPGAPVKVIYKATISQETGECWENVPITLETATPTLGLLLPTLEIWTLSHVVPPGGGGGCLGVGGAKRHRRIIEPDDLDFDMEHESTAVTSKGNVNATFRIPGITTIPSDKQEHNVTIAELDLDATMSWVCIPKGDTRVHLKATITNSSNYTFLPGSSNVYVDQSFISRSNVPNVSPKEVFDCPLGLDTSIRVTYHPRSKMISQSGFYNKSTTHAISQTITIHNTKSVGIEKLKITDNIPVSQDANITVNLISPSLTTPLPSSATRAAPPMTVANGVVAQWSDSGSDVNVLGKDGRLDWICSIPAHGKINLLLQWEASTTQRKAIEGL